MLLSQPPCWQQEPEALQALRGDLPMPSFRQKLCSGQELLGEAAVPRGQPEHL